MARWRGLSRPEAKTVYERVVAPAGDAGITAATPAAATAAAITPRHRVVRRRPGSCTSSPSVDVPEQPAPVAPPGRSRCPASSTGCWHHPEPTDGGGGLREAGGQGRDEVRRTGDGEGPGGHVAPQR